jgi:hypothetical protein
MSEWAARITDHRVWKVMADLGPRIDEAENVEGIEPSAVESLERLRAVLAFCGKRLGATDPLTMTIAPIDAIATSFQTATTEVEAFTNDKNIDHLTVANTSGADQALGYLAQVPGIATEQELVGLVQAATESRRAFEQHAHKSSESVKKAEGEIGELRKALESTQSAITTLQGQIDTERQKITTQFSEQQKVFGDAQEARSNNFNETLRKLQESLSQTLTDHQRQFSEAQESRVKDFSSTQAESLKKFNDTIADYSKRLTDQDAEFTKKNDAALSDHYGRLIQMETTFDGQAREVLKNVNQHRQDVEKLVGVIGNLGVTSGYQTNANIARKTMWFWQGVSVAAFIGIFLFAYHAFLPSMVGEFRWGSFATRVFLTITIGAFAAYAVSQADRFYKMESKNRRLALELAAIDPFLAFLPQEDQFKFKLEMARRTFAQEEPETDPKADKSPATALDVIASKETQVIVQSLVELVKAVRK